MSLTLGKAFAFFTTKYQVSTMITDALATRGITITAANYTALVTDYPAADHNGAFAWVDASQGTAWLPGTIGGTYYPLGLYHSNGTDWIFTPSPSQATQSEVNAGLNNDKFVTPQTFNDSAQLAARELLANKATTFTGNTSSDIKYPSVKAVVDYYNSLIQNVPAWTANTAYPSGQVIRNGFSLYISNAAIPDNQSSFTSGTSGATWRPIDQWVSGVTSANYASQSVSFTLPQSVFDITTMIGVATTTTGIVVTMPAPATGIGTVRILRNFGLNAFTVPTINASQTIAPDQAVLFVYIGTYWASFNGTATINAASDINYSVYGRAQGTAGEYISKIEYSNKLTFNPVSGLVTANSLSVTNASTVATLTSNNGGDSSTAAVTISGANGYGGANYQTILKMANTGGSVTNGNKFVRIAPNGDMQILNSAASASIFTLSDAGNVSAPDVTLTGTMASPLISSTNGGADGTSALTLTGNNSYGGIDYYGAITLNNTGATNGKKFFRITPTGTLEIVNDAYSSVIFSLADSGAMTFGGEIAADSITVSGANAGALPLVGYRATFNGGGTGWMSYIDNLGNRIFGDYSDTARDTWINSGRDVFIVPGGVAVNYEGPASRFDADGKLWLNCVGTLAGQTTGGQMVMECPGDMATWKSNGSGNNGLNLWQTGTTTNAMIAFQKGATQSQIGSIACTTTATSYNTSSDYRLKNITGPITNSGAYIDSLNPVEGTWKVDGSAFVGLIAHEAQEVSRTPVATGEKDGEQMQAMDYSSPEIIANLIAEVQSLRRRLSAAGIAPE